MPYLIIILIVLAFIFLPQFWVSHVLKKYNRNPEDNFPGTGAELARHLLDKLGLTSIKVESTEQGDHYDPIQKAVRLTPDKYLGGGNLQSSAKVG